MPEPTEAMRQHLDNKVRKAVTKFNAQNWIRFAIVEFTTGFKEENIRYNFPGVTLEIIILGIKDKFVDSMVSVGGLTENDRLMAGYLGLYMEDETFFNERLRINVTIAPEFFTTT